MPLNSIESEWSRFELLVFSGSGVSDEQRSAMKTAFFAGATVIVEAIIEIGQDHVTEEQGAAYLEALKDECIKYGLEYIRKTRGNHAARKEDR